MNSKEKSLTIDFNETGIAIQGLNLISDQQAINELSLIDQAVLMLLAARRSCNKEEACLNYGYLSRDITEFLEQSLTNIDQYFPDKDI